VLLACIPGVLLSLLYEYRAVIAAGAAGFPLDDAWIHAQFARNLATGAGFSYTGGTWVSGSTAPAWTILLAAAYFVFRHIVLAAVVAGIACQMTSGYYGYKLAQHFGVDGAPAALAGALVALTPVVVWGSVSGMEVPLATCLVLAGIYYALRHDDAGRAPVLGITLLTLGALARPESLALVAIVIAADLMRPGSLTVRFTRAVTSAALAGLVFAPLVAFSYATLGRPLPSTFYAKSGPGIVRALELGNGAMAWRDLTVFGPAAVKNFGLILVDQLSVAAWVVPVGLVACLLSGDKRRAGLVILAALTVAPFAMGMTAPQRLKPDNVRYAAQLVALSIPMIAVGAAWLLRGWRAGEVLVMVAAAAIVSWQTVDGAAGYASSVKNIQQLHVTAGRWMHDHLPAGTTVATNDVGAIAYFSGHPILDLEGLVSPVALDYRSLRDRGLRLVTDAKPAYLAIFPHWYPDLASRSDLFTEVHRVHIPDNYISAGDTLVVYRTPWAPAGSREDRP